MRLHPSVPAACAAVAVLAATGSAPVLAAGQPVPAAGAATSGVTLLSVTAAGHDLAAGGVRLVADTVAGAPVARVVVTPLVADGTTHGEQVVEAGTQRTVEGVSSSTVVPALKGIVELTGPALSVGALTGEGTATSTAGASTLGGLSVLGLPVQVAGVLQSGAAVSGTAAQSTKTLEVTDVALPSIADLLAALGLDLSALPVDVLTELVTELDLLTPAVTAADQALDDAQARVRAQTDAATAEVARQTAAVDAATKDLAARTAAADALTAGVLGSAAARTAAADAVTAADATVAARQQAATSARAALAALPATLPLGLGTVANPALAPAQAAVVEADALLAQAQTAAAAAATALAAARTTAELQAAALAAAQDAVVLARAALASAERLLDAAQKALADLLGALRPQVQALLAALTAVLDGTPLVRLDEVSVGTESVVTSALPGGQRAGVEGGEVAGLEVLGTDVLDDVLGSSRVSVASLTGTRLDAVTDAVDALTGTLSEVLSTVPGLPALKVPAPQVDVLTSTATTDVEGAFGVARTTVTGLQVTLPAITLPAEVALPDALQLPGLSLLPRAALPSGLSALAVGDVLTSTATTLGFGTLTETARFRAAAAGVPTTGTSTDAPGTAPGSAPEGSTDGGSGTSGPTTSPTSLPRTGATPGLAVLALVLVGGAVVARRRSLV